MSTNLSRVHCNVPWLLNSYTVSMSTAYCMRSLSYSTICLQQMCFFHLFGQMLQPVITILLAWTAAVSTQLGTSNAASKAIHRR